MAIHSTYKIVSLFRHVALSHLRFRPAASDLLRACVLVLHSLLWTKPAGRRNIPRLSAFPHCGWLHRPLKFRALLPGPALQRQPQRHRGDDPETHRYPNIFNWSNIKCFSWILGTSHPKIKINTYLLSCHSEPVWLALRYRAQKTSVGLFTLCLIPSYHCCKACF